MCEEYDDARMKAFWRALAEERAEDEIESREDGTILKPIVVEPLVPEKPKAKALVR